MKPQKTWHSTAAMVFLVFALLATFNGFKSLKSGERIPVDEAARRGYYAAVISVPLVLYIASAGLFLRGRSRRRRDSETNINPPVTP
jgi:hypothetical protein